MANKKRSIGHIKKIEDGKYLLRLSLGFDDFGKRIQPSKVVHCTSDREAERLLIEFHNEQKRLARVNTKKIPGTLEALYHDWSENHVKINLTEKTAEFYDYLWTGYIEPYGNLKLTSATPKNIYKILQATDKPRTRNAIYKMLKSMFNKSIKWGYITNNPCDQIDTPKYKSPEKTPLSEEEIKLVMDNITAEETKYQALFYFAALCGMRRQEIVPLKWSDIDFANNEFFISRASTQLKGKGTVTKDTKTEKSVRKLSLPAPLKNVLLRHMNEQAEQKHKLGDKWHDNDLIFTQWDGKIMSIQTPSHWWREFADSLGITDVTFHGLRHTAASYMIVNEVPITTVSGVLGHSNATTTLNIYAHIIENTKQGAIDILTNVYTARESTEEEQEKKRFVQ